MRATDAYGDLVSMGQPVVETREAAARLKTSSGNASRILRSVEHAGLVRQIRRGVWAMDPAVDPFVVAPYLTAPYPAYVSMWSALARHDMIEQIPRSVFVVSLARTEGIETTLGAFSVHHITPELFTGFTGSASAGYLATPEKALFDTVYLAAARGGSAHFPEIALPARFDDRAVERWLNRIERPRLRTLVSRALEQVSAP